MGIIVEKTDDNVMNKEEDNRESVAVAKHSKYEWMFPTFEVTKTHKTVLAGVALTSFFAMAYRSAFIQMRTDKRDNHQHPARNQLSAGVRLASRALGIGTILAVSGTGLLILATFTLLGVQSTKEFGDKMRANLGGTRFQINRREPMHFDSFRDLIEHIDKKDTTDDRQ